jgi:hypothetical protein
MPIYDVPMGDPLDMLVEECAEVVQEAMKIRRFGMEGTKEWAARGEDPPRKRLIQEVGDVLVIVDILLAHRVFTIEQLNAAKARKSDRLCELFGFNQVFDA